MTTTITRVTRPRTVAAVSGALFVLAISGCAGNDETPEPDAPAASDANVQAEVEPTDQASLDEAPTGQLGTITVGSTTYNVLESVNCELMEADDLVDRTFDVIAVAQSASGEDALFFAYTDEQTGAPGNFIDYQGPEGTLMTSVGDATFVVSGGNLSGSGALVDDANTQSFTVEFNFDIPEERVEC